MNTTTIVMLVLLAVMTVLYLARRRGRLSSRED
jgi:hypothetical protein